MAKEAYYFSHDANARNDPKILAMRSEFGIQGYGVYWIIIEMLREEENYKLPLKKYIWNAIAMQVQCKDYANDNAKSFVDSCINDYELFDSDGEFFWSNSLIKRMAKKNDLSEKRKSAAKARWDKTSNTKHSTDDDNKNAMQNDANAMQVDANAMQNDASKEKESKEKEKKEDINTSCRKSKTYDKESIPYQLSLRLLKNIRNNNSEFKEPNLQKWSDDFRLMMERDNRTEEQIAYLIDWCQQDSFWKSNILSPTKLRKQFDQLVLKIKSNREFANSRNNSSRKSLFEPGEETKKRMAALPEWDPDEAEKLKKEIEEDPDLPF